MYRVCLDGKLALEKSHLENRNPFLFSIHYFICWRKYITNATNSLNIIFSFLHFLSGDIDTAQYRIESWISIF